MEQKYLFSEQQIPYDILEQFGLDRDMIEDLPYECLSNILIGKRSPILPITFKDESGNLLRAKTRINLYYLDDGKVNVLFFPQLKRSQLENFNDAEREALLLGKTIVTHSPVDSSLKCFVQIDKATNQVLYIPTQIIGRNISCISEYFNISDKDLETLYNGDLLTFRNLGSLITAGIDLNERTGIHIVEGDNWDWQNSRQNLEKYNFGVAGCWIRDDEGNLDRYVYEDDYTEEIISEWNKAIARNSVQKR